MDGRLNILLAEVFYVKHAPRKGMGRPDPSDYRWTAPIRSRIVKPVRDLCTADTNPTTQVLLRPHPPPPRTQIQQPRCSERGSNQTRSLPQINGLDQLSELVRYIQSPSHTFDLMARIPSPQSPTECGGGAPTSTDYSGEFAPDHDRVP
jgi:hypothetical protein